MKTFKIHQSFFFGTNPGYKKQAPDEEIEFLVPNSLDVVQLMSYLNHRRFKKQDVSPQQLNALLELLTEAEGFGHDINRMLLRATAGDWSQVVYESHLKPKESVK